MYKCRAESFSIYITNNTNKTMSFTPPKNQSARPLIPKGTHIARLYSIVDLGIQEGEWKGQKIEQHKIYITFELPNELREFDGLQKPMVIGSKYTWSMGSKARLRPVIEALIGTSLTDAEAANFDLESANLLGKPCMVSVSHFEGTNGTSSSLDAVVPLMKGAECPPQFNQSVFYKISDGASPAFEALPNFLKEIIGKSKSTLKGDDMDSVKAARDAHNSDIFKDMGISDEKINIPF